MIGRLIDHIAARLMDHRWLRAMRRREVDSLRSVHHAQRRQRLNPISEAAFPTSDTGRRR